MKTEAIPSQFHLIVIAFVLSAAMMAYEILLTRVASLLLTNQYIFLILGVSLLGISMGAILEYYLVNRQKQAPEAKPGLWLCLSAGTLVLALIFILKVGADRGLLVIAFSAALPFAVSGFIFSRLFRLFIEMTGSLYAADLAGAAVGALMVPLLLPALGPVQSILSLAALLAGFGAISILFYNRGGRTLIIFTVTVAIVVIWFMNNDNALLGKIPIGKNPDKDLHRIMSMYGGSAEIIESRWSTFGRTDLVHFEGDSSIKSIFIDGAAGTSMLRFNGDFEDSSTNFLHATRRFGGMIPLLGMNEQQKDNALIIGPGGGRDVLLTLMTGFKEITAVEINPQMIEIVKDYDDFNGGIYTDYKNVQVVIAEGRDYLRHSEDKYDLITLFMPVTKSSRSLKAFALSESYLFTREAFADYHRHLTDEGSLLIMAHSMPEIMKIMATAMKALQDEGLTVKQAMDHLYILGSEMMPLFGMHKTPIQPEEGEFLHAAAHFTMFDCQYSYIPGVEQEMLQPVLTTSIDAGIPMMNPLFIDLAEGKMPFERLQRGLGFNFVPASDNRPFFFQYVFGLPEVIQTVLWFGIAVLGAVLLLPGYHIRIRLQAEIERFSWWIPLFFVAIGIGYIVIELALFQKLVFFLGDPARSLALLLGALLVGSGVGSFISRKSQHKAAIVGGLLSTMVAMLILIFLPMIFSSLHDSSLSAKYSIAAILLFIQGVPMGMLFPVGLRLAERQLGKSAVPWMWAVNGSASVVGSALAIAIAMSAGYTWSLIFGTVCYIFAALSMQIIYGKTKSAINSKEISGESI